MTMLSGKHKLRLALLAVLSLFLAAGPADLAAKGFRGGGGSRSVGHMGGFRSPSRSSGSKSFSGSGGFRRSSGSKPSYDVAAGRARSHEISAQNFRLWGGSKSGRETPSFNPTWAESRPQRMATTFGSRQPTGYYYDRPNVVIYHDSYDNSFMKYATLMWLFNHWGSVDHSRFDNARIRDLETRFKDLEAKGVKPDPNYNEPGVDPDLAYNKDVAYRQQGMSPLGKFFWLVTGGGLIVWGIWFVFVRRIPYTG